MACSGETRHLYLEKDSREEEDCIKLTNLLTPRFSPLHSIFLFLAQLLVRVFFAFHSLSVQSILTAAGQSLHLPFTMHTTSIIQLLAVALLATPLVSGLPAAPADLERRSVVSD